MLLTEITANTVQLHYPPKSTYTIFKVMFKIFQVHLPLSGYGVNMCPFKTHCNFWPLCFSCRFVGPKLCKIFYIVFCNVIFESQKKLTNFIHFLDIAVIEKEVLLIGE